MEKDNLNDNEINANDKAEETETMETEQVIDTKVNKKVESFTINNDETIKKSFSKIILANVLDQLLIVAGSSLLLLLCDLILKLFGYMFVRGNGALILAGGIIYFIINCVYAPIMEKSKLKNTIAKKILNVN